MPVISVKMLCYKSGIQNVTIQIHKMYINVKSMCSKDGPCD